MNRAGHRTHNQHSNFQWRYVPYVIIAFLVIANAWLLSFGIGQNQACEPQIIHQKLTETKPNPNTNSNIQISDSISVPIHRAQQPQQQQIEMNSNPNDHNTKTKNTNENNDNNECHFPNNFTNLIYVYDIPYDLRELPRKNWYEMFYRRNDYENKVSLNYGFGDIMEIALSEGSNIDNSGDEYYYTHMHSLEIIFNERMQRQSSKYITDDPSKASLFWIPFPFALHFRYWHGRSWDTILEHHQTLQNWLDNNSVYKANIGKKPHFITYGRISYETGQIRRHGSAFWVENRYWVLSIDRNCHGDPDSCWKRISMPHPSVYHPNSIESLKQRIHQSSTNKRDILVSFCGAVRTPTRQQAMDVCKKTKKHPKWKTMFSGSLCEFEDSLLIEEEMKKSIGSQGERRRRIELLFSKQCTELYERSVFCIQQGADSTTRKGLWDGIVAGCIPVFLNGVMDGEFDCYGGNNYPWYVVLNPDYYVKQLLSFSADHIELLQRNLRRMVPKVIYTNGEAGFSDAIDVIIACMLRKTAIENSIDNPQCTPQTLVNHDWFEMDQLLGYDKLYPILGIS